MYEENDYETEPEEMPSEFIQRKTNWKGSIYDDDDFEKIEGSIECDYQRIIKERRSKMLKNHLKSEALFETKIVQPSLPPAPLSTKTWEVKKVDVPQSVAGDFPSLSDAKITQTPQSRHSDVKAHLPKKWKKITDVIFNEESTTIEQQFSVVQPKRSPAPRENRRLLTSTEPKKSPENHSSPETTFRNTKLCNFGESCKKRGKGCNYAHTLEEFSPVECRFQKTCKNRQVCGFKHGDESKEEFLLRTKPRK
jgi:hypothetical protein